MGDLAALIGKLMGCSIQIETEDKRVRPDKSEVERLLAGNALAASILKWQPKVALEEGLTQTIDWLRQNTDKYRASGYVI